jgi:hypothetical protein
MRMRSAEDRYGRAREQCREVYGVVHKPILRMAVTPSVTPLGRRSSPPVPPKARVHHLRRLCPRRNVTLAAESRP